MGISFQIKTISILLAMHGGVPQDVLQFAKTIMTQTGTLPVPAILPEGKTLRELAMPFDWAGFLERQIREGKELAKMMHLDEQGLESLQVDKQRYEHALEVLRDPLQTIFTLVLLPERLPIAETQSAINGLQQLGIGVHTLVVNQVIRPDVNEGNRFLAARANLQTGYLAEIEQRFPHLKKYQIPLFDYDTASIAALREVGEIFYGNHFTADTDPMALSEVSL